jgi:hypothetical protein
MRKITLAVLAVLLAASFAAAEMPVNQYVSSDDGSIALLVKYYPGVSTNTSATVAVVQGTSLTFQVASAAYTGFECPVSGALGGVIDETNGSCDTLGEIADVINATAESFSTGFFRAVIVDGLRTDSADDLLADGGTQVTRADGLPIYFDTSANFAVGETRALLPTGCRDDIACFVTPAGKLIENPFAGQQTRVQWVEGYSTYGSGTSGLRIYSVKPSQKASGAETVTTLWAEAMGATATNKQFTQFQYVPALGRPNEKVIVRVVNSEAQASVVLLAAGVQSPVP